MQRGRPFLHKIRAPCAPYCAASPHILPLGSQVRQLPMTYHEIVSQFPTIYHDFFFALPLGEMCMHFRVFRRAFLNISTKREKRVRMSECCADRRALYSSTHPL